MKSHPNHTFVSNLFFVIIGALSIFLIIAAFLPIVEGRQQIICNPFTPRSRWSYDAISGDVFDDRNFLCRVFDVRSSCFNEKHLPRFISDAMNRYFDSPNPKTIDYSDFFKFLENKGVFTDYCSDFIEHVIDITRYKTCPSVLRYTFQNGIKDCPNKNLLLRKGWNNSTGKGQSVGAWKPPCYGMTPC